MFIYLSIKCYFKIMYLFFPIYTTLIYAYWNKVEGFITILCMILCPPLSNRRRDMYTIAFHSKW